MGKDDLRVAIKPILENYQTTLEMGLWIGTPTECLIDYQSQKSFSAASISKLVLYAYYLEQIIEEKSVFFLRRKVGPSVSFSRR